MQLTYLLHPCVLQNFRLKIKVTTLTSTFEYRSKYDFNQTPFQPKQKSSSGTHTFSDRYSVTLTQYNNSPYHSNIHCKQRYEGFNAYIHEF